MKNIWNEEKNDINKEGTKIQGRSTVTSFDYYNSFVKGYESNDTNSKCPLNCHQCLQNKQCIECKNGTVYVGTREGDSNQITCEDEEPIGFWRKCNDGNTCNSCSPTHYLNPTKKYV